MTAKFAGKPIKITSVCFDMERVSKIKAFNLIIFYLILPVSNEESKHKCPRFAFPECPGGRITTLSTLPRPPSVSESSESKKLENI